MASLTVEARTAWDAVIAQQQAAIDADWAAQQQAALDELRLVLTRPAGTVLTLAEVGLSRVHADLDAGLIVWSDGTVSLGCQRVTADPSVAEWHCRLLRKVDGQWTSVVGVGRLRSLADLGSALVA